MRIAATLLALTAIPALAGEPKVPAGHVDVEPLADNPWFTADPHNPRVLIRKPGAGIDDEWVRRMSSPQLSDDAWARLQSARAARGPVQPEAPNILVGPGALTSPYAAAVGDIFVIQGSAATVVTTQGGVSFNHSGDGLNQVLSAVLGSLGDNYDFISVFTTFSDQNAAAYYMPIQQNTDGLGECNLNTRETFGCLYSQFDGRLQGFVFMNSLDFWAAWDESYDGFVHALNDFDATVFASLGQEIAHRWGSGLRFVDPRDGRVSKGLLGRDNSHWAAWVDTDGSVMDGWDWEIDGDRFELVGDMNGFSTLDLYTMGAVPVAAAKPFFFIDNAIFEINGNDFLGLDGRAIPADAVLQIPSDALLDENGMHIGARGERVDLTIQDVVDAEGNRCPDPDATQKTFRQAFVLVTLPTETASSEDVQFALTNLDTVRTTWEDWWLDRTNKNLRLCTDLVGNCTHPQIELGGGDVSFEGESLQPGAEANLELQVKNIGDAGLINPTIHIKADDDSAPFLEFAADTDVDDVAAGSANPATIPIRVRDDYPCGAPATLTVTVSADNAATITETARLFPGYKELIHATFDEGEDGFATNVDDKDGASSAAEGALARADVEMTCDMTKRTPERDASIGGRGAWVTGPGSDHVPDLIDGDNGTGSELDGDTSLWSSSIEVTGTRDPEFRFAYWLDGEPGDKLQVQLSGDSEKTWVTAKEYEESFHGWVLGRVSVRDVLNEVPERITIRFVFQGGGTLEGGIDEVRLLDFDGKCLSFARGGFCGCDTTGASTSGTSLLALVGGLVLLRLRRRSRM